MKGQASTHVDAAPEAVYDLVSDVTRMGELSPECYRCEWVDGATGPAEGAKFKGWNRIGRFIKWTTTPEVMVADRGKEFTFKTPQTIWSYTFAEVDGGTIVTEGYEITSGLTGMYTKLFGRAGALQSGMEQTLARVKAAAEK
ncbi:MAG TPA: SRPBCC family protein [Acidimicrobiales bacterium]|nr:SRPBCC family protein [Acidimicrobiales bacterium]